MSENIYMELFLTSFFQTLGQLSAGAVAAVVGVPLYVYYAGVRNNTTVNYEDEDEDEDEHDDDEHFEDSVEQDSVNSMDSDL